MCGGGHVWGRAFLPVQPSKARLRAVRQFTSLDRFQAHPPVPASAPHKA